MWPKMDKVVDTLYLAEVSVVCGIDESLPKDDGGYYQPALNAIFFSKSNIGEIAIQHEFMHLVQDKILHCNMYSQTCKRNMEFEVDVICDVLNYQRGIDYRGGSSDKYKAFIRDIAKGACTFVEIKRLFNELLSEYPLYKNLEECKNYTPGLIDYILLL